MNKFLILALFTTFYLYSKEPRNKKYAPPAVYHRLSEAVFRSIVFPGWGQFYNYQPLKGTFIILGEITLIAGGVFMNSFATKAYVQYLEAKNPEKALDLYSKVKQREQIRDILFYSALGLYLYNIFDAWLVGRRLNKKFYGMNFYLDKNKFCFTLEFHK